MVIAQSPHRVAAAVLGGALLWPLSQDLPDTLASCRPVRIEAAEPALDTAELRLARYLAHRYYVDLDQTERVVRAAYQAAAQVGLDPLLVLAVAGVESSFNPLAESVAGARGLMQIIPRYHREKLGLPGADELLFDPEANILLGTRILQEYIYRTGTLEAGLQFYNGAFFDASAQYARKVMAERLRLEAVLRGRDGVREATLSAAAS